MMEDQKESKALALQKTEDQKAVAEDLEFKITVANITGARSNIASLAVVDALVKEVLSKHMSRGQIKSILPDMISVVKEVLA